MKTHVIYHANCSDGAAAALIAEQALGKGIKLIPMQHGAPFSIDELRHGRVFILDFSFDRETIKELAACSQLIVLDHHATAEKALEGIPGCVFDMDKCGARLTWEHFHDREQTPWWVDYIEDRDLWRWKLSYSKAVNAALRSYGIGIEGLREALLWEDGKANREIIGLVNDGGAILREQEQIVVAHLERAEHVLLFGQEVQAVNATVLQSEIAGALAEEHDFGACWFEKLDGTRVWSLRSRKNHIDVGELAKLVPGGGGNPGSAGFTQRPGEPLP